MRVKVVNTYTGEVLGSISANHSMTHDECIEFVGGEIVRSEYDPRYRQEGDNVILNGARHFYEDIDTICVDDD